MDLSKALRDLYAEKEKIERTIALLEEIHRSASGGPALPETPKRRGRKLMGAEERKQVSERMRKYWAARRNSRDAPTNGPKSRAGQ